MAVLPINSVSTNANQYTFTGKKDKNSHKANPLASVPVIVMLAMAPMAEGKQPAQFVPIDSEHLTEVLAQANSIAPNAYAYSQAPQNEAPLGVRYYTRYGKVQEVINAKANGNDVTLVFYSTRKDALTLVNYIHFFDHSYDKNSLKLPPSIQELVYHDLGPGEEFCGVKLYKKIKNKKSGQISHVEYEYKLDDTSAQKIIDLIAGDSKWTNRTNIKFSETTSPNVAPPKVVWVEE